MAEACEPLTVGCPCMQATANQGSVDAMLGSHHLALHGYLTAYTLAAQAGLVGGLLCVQLCPVMGSVSAEMPSTGLMTQCIPSPQNPDCFPRRGRLPQWRTARAWRLWR